MGAVACFGIGAFCAGAIFRSVLPRPYVEVLDEKLADLRGQAAPADVLFVGSSRIYHGIIPDQLDADLRARGIMVRSYNLGVDGMVPPESFTVLEEVLRHKPAPAWILIELPPYSPRIDNYLGDGVRTVWWHDWTNTLLSLESIAGEPSSDPALRADLAQTHARLFLRSALSLGTGAEFLAKRIGSSKTTTPAKKRKRQSQWIGARGFVPMREDKLDDVEKYHAALAAYREVPVHARLSEPFRQRLQTLVATVKGHGSRPVFVITPSLNARSRLVSLREQGIDADLIALNDAERFPTLFEDAVRVDGAHLNRAGAHELTRLMAEEFARLR